LRLIKILLFIFGSIELLAQSYAPTPDIYARGLSNDHFVSAAKDSVFIKGLENKLAINFKNNTDTIQFQLLGLDPKMQSSPYPSIRYTNLSGGKYTLKYKLQSQPDFKNIIINIEEAIWQKWWFFPMMAGYFLLLVGVGVYFFSLYNFRQKMKVQLMRNKISADLHDEVGSNLSSIAIYTQVLRKGIKSPELLPVLDKIMINSKESVQLMQDTVWALNPKNDSAERLFARIETYAKAIFGEKNISYQQVAAIDFEQIKLSMEDRKNLYMILKEGINNIAKHAEATQVTLQIFEEHKHVNIVLKDNGVGFDNTQNTEGNGLRNFKERAEASGFELVFKSVLGEGTELKLIV
jgi:Histidine kinase